MPATGVPATGVPAPSVRASTEACGGGAPVRYGRLIRLPSRFIQLPLRVDADGLAAEVAALPPSAWRDHPEGAPGNTAVPLVAVDGDPANNSSIGAMRPTPHLADLPYTRRIMAALGSTVGRSRLMRVVDEGTLDAHVDVNYYWLHHLRVHVPVQTTPDAVLEVEEEARHLPAGEVWVFDTWRRHRVENLAGSPRIHLVIDTVGSASLWSMIGGAASGTTPVGSDDAALQLVEAGGPEPDLAWESYNWPEVMSAAEMDGIVTDLAADTESVDVAAAARARAVLGPLCRDWRDLEARFGSSVAGAATRTARISAAREQVATELADIVLPNGNRLSEVLDHLVFRPAQSPRARRPAARPAPVVPASSPDLAARLVAGPARIDRPVFIVSPPRSGSSLLFETLGRAPDVFTIGAESHGLIEGVRELTPAARDWASNRLGADDATEGTVAFLKDRFVGALRDRNGSRPQGGQTRMLEKTPKNALRVPFLAEAFPDARFVYLYRDPRETISSMLDAWRSGRFVTYPDLPGWEGPPWSLLLVPGWRDLIGRPLPEVVAHQWATTVDTLLDDLAALESDRWCVASYDRLVAEPDLEMRRLCAFLGMEWDLELAAPLPNARHTLDSPHPEKWQRNADDVLGQQAVFTPAAERAREVFAAAPRIEPVPTATPWSTVAAPARPVSAPPGGGGPAPANPAVAPPPVDAGVFGARSTVSMYQLLDQLGATLVITTYQAGKLLLIRPTPEGLNSHYRSLPVPMGVSYNGRDLAVGLRGEVVVFQNQPALGARLQPPGWHDACFVTRRRHATGDIRVHDLSWGNEGLWVVNTRFSCLATLDDAHSFVPRWQPGFISELAAEDRCHLNGLAMVDGDPRYVTVLGMSDEPNGWREHKADGGAILEVPSGAPVTTGLAMPHSPRWHDGKLWVLESGVGALAVVDPETGVRQEVARVPGFARGLTFAGRYALVGLSKVREHVFDGLPLTRDNRDGLQCGVWVIDTTTGDTVATLSFDGAVQEIFDVALLPGMRHPELVEPGAPLADTAFVLPDLASVPSLR